MSRRGTRSAQHLTMRSLLLPALALAACAGPGTAAKEKSPADGGQAQAPAPLGGGAKGDSLFLYLERTPCFGHCKSYRIDLYSTGYATYDGRLNVEKEGLHRARIGADTLRSILKRAEELGFFAMQDKYDGPVTDLPSTFLRIVSGARSKTVMGRVGQPAAFRQLVEEIEALLLPVPWVPVAPEP